MMPCGPTLTCSPVGIAAVLMPGIVSRAICWISSCCSGVHWRARGVGCQGLLKDRGVPLTGRLTMLAQKRIPGGGWIDSSSGLTPSIAATPPRGRLATLPRARRTRLAGCDLLVVLPAWQME